MGTTYTVSIRSQTAQDTSIEKDVFNILNSINLDMSTYLEDSIISKVNQSEINNWIKVDKDFIEVLDYAKELCKKTNGIYDVTIGKMVDLWGFGSKEISGIPSEKEINYLKKQVGCNSIDIDKKQNLIKRNKELKFDPAKYKTKYTKNTNRVIAFICSLNTILSSGIKAVSHTKLIGFCNQNLLLLHLTMFYYYTYRF